MNESAPDHQVIRASFLGNASTLTYLVFFNIILSILTLGLYSFWGKAKIRRYLWGNIECANSRLSYHGTAKELLVGYFFAVVILLALTTGTQWHYPDIPQIGYGVNALCSLLLITLFGYAKYSSRSYLMSRTSWRSIRFWMESAHQEYITTFLRGIVFSILSFGLFIPVMTNQLYRIKTTNTRLGDRNFMYTGKDKEVFFIFLRCLPLIILTLGLFFFWYRAIILQYRTHNTWIGDASGAAHGILYLTGGDLLKLNLFNLTILVFTLGLGLPFILAYNISFIAKRVAFVGPIQLDKISQKARETNPVGHGIASAMDIGVGG